MVTSWTKLADNTTTYTNVAKAVFSSVVSGNSGIPMGLLMALTYADSSTSITDPWVDVSKASGTSFTNVAKAT